MSRDLNVWFNETEAGRLSQDDGGALTFAYDADWIASREARAISVSMPLREQPYADAVAKPFFSGLLPDEAARRKLASALGVSSGNAFGLLEIIGGECAGALSLYPGGQSPPAPDNLNIQVLDDRQLAEILDELRARPLLGGEKGIRLSLAGAQDKLAVCVEGDAIGLARGGRPTTHILKPFMEQFEGTVENELFCMRLAARLKLPVPNVTMRLAGNAPFFLVERYDRVRDKDGIVRRLHQEDFCQALSVAPELKYENEGGPGAQRSLDLIASSTARPAADRLTFIRMLIFHYLIGNADAHAKNYALLYRDRVPDLAPVYDAMCTAAYPRIIKNFAMEIGGRSVPDTIGLAEWLTLVPDGGPATRLLTNDLRRMATAVRTEADELLKELASDGIEGRVLSLVRKVIETRSKHVLDAADSARG